MQFIQSPDWSGGASALYEYISSCLHKNQRVLWLVSGGTNIQIATDVMNRVPEALSTLLSVALVDERYGTPGHKDSNWQQLQSAGFNPRLARVVQVLEPPDSFDKTVERYHKAMREAFSTHDFVIAQLGIGTDGHIAGILPDTPAAQETSALVTGYQSSPYMRITLTFAALRHCNSAYVFAFGDNKYSALQQLQTAGLSLSVQPAQILRELPEAYVYNDQVGENL